MAGYGSHAEALGAVGEIFAAGIVPCALEYIGEGIIDLMAGSRPVPWPREVRYRYAVKLDFSRQRLSRHRLRSLLRLLLREQPRYRRMDRVVTLGVLSWIAPWLLRRRRDSALTRTAMGIETIFR